MQPLQWDKVTIFMNVHKQSSMGVIIIQTQSSKNLEYTAPEKTSVRSFISGSTAFTFISNLVPSNSFTDCNAVHQAMRCTVKTNVKPRNQAVSYEKAIFIIIKKPSSKKKQLSL